MTVRDPAAAGRILVLIVAMIVCGAVNAAAGSWVVGPRAESIALRASPDQKLYLEARINGRKVTLFIDTGANTIIDSRIAAELSIETRADSAGFGISGRTENQATGIARTLEIGNMTLHDYPVTFLDLGATRKLHADLDFPDIDGVIGADVLSALGARIDFRERVLVLRRPRMH